MAGKHAFEQLRSGLSADSQRQAAALTDAMEQELSLAELRRARTMTQEQLASDLYVGQASIAKLERRADMYSVHAAALRRSDGRRAGHRGPLPRSAASAAARHRRTGRQRRRSGFGLIFSAR
jgi:hypothetical protein